MKIEKINENKIKVLIDEKEAEKWNVSFENISQNTPEVQEMFWAAIRLAEECVDFSVEGAKLFVEAVRDTEPDGFGMLITRVVSEKELQDAIAQCSYQGRLKKTQLKRKVSDTRKRVIYRFSEFESVCNAVGEIGDRYQGMSSLYKYQSAFYLYLLPDAPETLPDLEMVLTEFGEKVESCLYMQGRLHEYGEAMISCGAVEVMKEYFAVC